MGVSTVSQNRFSGLLFALLRLHLISFFFFTAEKKDEK